MNQSSRNKNLLFVIAFLLITNIAVLAYFLWFKKNDEPQKGTRSRGNGLSEMLRKDVGFNESQVAQYKALKDEQFKTMKPMFDEMRKAKDSLFRMMSDSSISDSVISNAAAVIGEKQKALDLESFNHFKKVRTLCTSKEQKVRYDSAMFRMFRKMGRPARKAEDKTEKK